MGAHAKSFFTLILIGFFSFPGLAFSADSPLLSPEENLWLSARNDTIVVYPEKNYPPFSYQSPAGNIQGLSVDYIELIAKILGVKVHYAVPRARNQIIDDFKNGKGDVVLSLTPTEERESAFVFTESFVKVPVVIVVRKDVDTKRHATMNDFVGKRVSVVDKSAAEEYLRKNYPRVVIETTTDNEVSLQQVVLGEVDAAVMDVASLSFLLSKQVISSVKTIGSVGLDYEPAFAVPKGKEMLQSILEKGLMQISTAEREVLAEKWVLLPGGQAEKTKTMFSFLQKDAVIVALYVFTLVVIVVILAVIFRPATNPFRYRKKQDVVGSLESEMALLEDESKVLAEELREVQEKEKEIAEKIQEIKG